MYKGLAADCMTAGSGWWLTNDNTGNMPVSSYKYGVLIVFYATSEAEVRMFFNNHGDRKIYSKSAGTSKGWVAF